MASADTLRKVIDYLSVPTDNPELVRAQCIALSRQIPMAYFVLIVNAWMLSITFHDKAPFWLSVLPPAALTVVFVIRLVNWMHVQRQALTGDKALRELRRAIRLTVVLCVVCLSWAVMLYPFGDQAARYHLALYTALMAISVMLCMGQLRTGALVVAITVGTCSVAFFAAFGTTTFLAIAVNVLCVIVAAAIIILVQHRDFARMVNAQTEVRRRYQEQARLLHMIDDMPVAVMTVDPETFNINYANENSRKLIDSIAHLLPIKADALIGTSIDVFHAHPQHQRRILSDPANLPHNARIKLGPEVLDLKVSAVMDDDGNYIGPMLTWALVTREIEAENRIRQLAHFDPLTGLANRHTFRERLDATLAAPDCGAALLFIDLDGFKLVNDTRGHHVGDELLKQVADRLITVCKCEKMTVGRLGGDEFALLLPDGDADEAMAMADTIIEALAEPFRDSHDWNLQIGASIGIAMAPEHGRDTKVLLSRADIALYAAKAAGKRTFRMFSQDMEARVQERTRLETKLREALKKHTGLFVFYQPIVDIETGKVTARESLIRWHHPVRGWISPGEFIPVAEDCGLIEPLAHFTLREACREAAGWKGGERVAVNVSAAQIGKGTLVDTVRAALAESGLDPQRLELEVTETALINEGNEGKDLIEELRCLRELGVRLALDDFGTGYSSLAHLRTFTFDKIKIDGSFVKDAVDRADCAAVIRGVTEIAARLGVTTVAEGVETEDQLDRVRLEGCKEVQGHLFGWPAPGARDAAVVEELTRTFAPITSRHLSVLSPARRAAG